MPHASIADTVTCHRPRANSTASIGATHVVVPPLLSLAAALPCNLLAITVARTGLAAECGAEGSETFTSATAHTLGGSWSSTATKKSQRAVLSNRSRTS